MKKSTSLVAVGILLLAVATYMPTASAHECQGEYGESSGDACSGECTEGEEHHHKITHHHENGWGEDENHIHYDCTSHKEDEGPTEDPCSSPEIAGVCLIDQDGQNAFLACLSKLLTLKPTTASAFDPLSGEFGC